MIIIIIIVIIIIILAAQRPFTPGENGECYDAAPSPPPGGKPLLLFSYSPIHAYTRLHTILTCHVLQLAAGGIQNARNPSPSPPRRYLRHPRALSVIHFTLRRITTLHVAS